MLLQKIYRSFTSSKVQISTKIFGVINVEINLEVDGRLYSIHAVEEQVGSNNMMWVGCVCKCKERDSPKSKNSMQGKNEDHNVLMILQLRMYIGMLWILVMGFRRRM